MLNFSFFGQKSRVNNLAMVGSVNLEKGVFCQKIPNFSVFPCRKKGIFDRKLPYPGRGEMGFLDLETLFFRKLGFGALSRAGGIPKLNDQKDRNSEFPSLGPGRLGSFSGAGTKIETPQKLTGR